MKFEINYEQIIKYGWEDYGHLRKIISIKDISVKVSTNHVFLLTLENNKKIIAKISDYGYFDHFLEDHKIINSLSLNLSEPFENFLAKSLTKKGALFTYQHKYNKLNIWVVFIILLELIKPQIKSKLQIILKFLVNN